MRKRWIHSSEKENAATLPRFCTWQPGLSRSPQSTSVPIVKEFDGIIERVGSHLNAAMQCPTVKVAPKHRLDADFYPPRGE